MPPWDPPTRRIPNKDLPGQDSPAPAPTPTPDHIHDVTEIRPSNARIPILRTDAKSTEGDPWVGKQVGPYVVQRALSRGGMGQVLLAMDEALRRPIALKVMDQKLLDDHDALKRFEREARATASIVHRNIAAVYLVGLADDGTPFLAMEFIDGGSLMDAIRQRKAFTFAQVTALMEQVADALQAAYRQSIIHRDIKPANIMLTQSGEARVVDFGLAKMFFEDSYMTREGMVLGTPSYMAPEQGQGRVVDHRADIYAFGATFYHVLTGRPPFAADSPVQIMMKHVTAPLVPMRSLNPAIPIEFDEIIGRCMRKDVDERYQEYESLLVDIKRLRLQCVAREQGSLSRSSSQAVSLGGGSSSSEFAVGASGSGFLPPPPEQRNSNDQAQITGIKQAPRSAPMPPTAIQNTGEAEGHSGWSPARIGMVAGVVVVLIGGIAVAMMQGSDPVEEAPKKSRAPIAVLMEKVAMEARKSKGGDKELPLDYVAALATMDILKSLRTALVIHRAENGELPHTLADIAQHERIVVNFEMDEAGNPLDAWSTPFLLDADTGAIRSAGMDRGFDTGDDIVHDIDRTEAPIPDVYTELVSRVE